MLLVASLAFYAYNGIEHFIFIGTTALSTWCASRAFASIAARVKKERMAAESTEAKKAAKKRGTTRKRLVLAAAMRIPGMRSLFMKAWDPLIRKVFGESSGFENIFYPKKKDEYRMDVISCPYFRYFSELGCPELTKVSCGADDKVYGNLPGLAFERTTTIGRGGERCDFCIRKV